MALVTVETSGQVATLTLNDPQRRNALSPELGDAFASALEGLRGVRAVVVQGAGGNFSTGGDLKMLQHLRTLQHADAKAFMLSFYARFLAVRRCALPVIAAVEGYAVGAGFCLALACDVLVLAEDAKVSLNFAKLGLAPGLGATVFAPRVFGVQRAFQLLATGETIAGRDVPGVIAPSGQALAQAQRLAQQIASNAPTVIKQNKRRFEVDLLQGLDEEADAQAHSYASKDLGEGLQAAKDKRAPRFEGV